MAKKLRTELRVFIGALIVLRAIDLGLWLIPDTDPRNQVLLDHAVSLGKTWLRVHEGMG